MTCRTLSKGGRFNYITRISFIARDSRSAEIARLRNDRSLRSPARSARRQIDWNRSMSCSRRDDSSSSRRDLQIGRDLRTIYGVGAESNSRPRRYAGNRDWISSRAEGLSAFDLALYRYFRVRIRSISRYQRVIAAIVEQLVCARNSKKELTSFSRLIEMTL